VLSQLFCLGLKYTVERTLVTAIVERLIVQAELTGARGRILYTDNWYMSIDLALYQIYGWHFCGTVAPTNKVVHQDMDLPFAAKLSKGAMKTIPCGWYQEVVLQMRVGRREFYVLTGSGILILSPTMVQ
jgi:hypothetical protein